MNGLETNEVYYTFQGQATDDHMVDADDEHKMPKEEALIKFIKFIREWRHENKYIYRYRHNFAIFLQFPLETSLMTTSQKSYTCY